jgi:hypothetical protein
MSEDATNLPEPGGSQSEFLLYQTQDKRTQIDVRLEGETVWLTQSQMVDLFQTTKQNISLHIRNVFEEGELQEAGTVKEYLTVQTEGGRSVSRKVAHYNLDVIISVGYRVKSHRGTQFRIWATQRLREYLVKGFTLDDQRLAEGGERSRYFDELLERVRAIRASERMFWQKVTDIYATSIDYDVNAPVTRDFFATVQNKFHFAIHGHTAAEIVVERANADKANMGLTTWKNAPDGPIRKTDVSIAKNYLQEEEMRQLNLIVDQYLSFAELQARQKKPMHMADWVRKLHDFHCFGPRTAEAIHLHQVSPGLCGRDRAGFQAGDRAQQEEKMAGFASHPRSSAPSVPQSIEIFARCANSPCRDREMSNAEDAEERRGN